MVVHLLTSTGDGKENPPQVGLVVSKAVGNAVRRNAVKRRIRASAAGRVADLPGGACVVVRALPSSAAASYQDLDEDLGACLTRAIKKAARGTRGAGRPLAETRAGTSAGQAGPELEPTNPTNGGTPA
ncbi:hypothetical protein GCM10028784_39160 [Myceligenerans cantabricum]